MPQWIKQARNDLILGALEKFIHASTLLQLRASAYRALGCFGRHLDAEKEGLFDNLDYPDVDKSFSQIKVEFIEDMTKFLQQKIR